jgi:meso-butanediol dehydrogenase/(S,S)-butanediol dehydrogenase/diacetyl reductase
MTGRLANKVAFITGTGGGQGRAAAILFAKEGARIIGCDLKEEGAKETVKMVTGTGGKMVSLQPLDLGDGKQVKKWIKFGIKTYGQMDILYNNASAPKFAPIDKLTEEDWRFTVRNELDLIYLACHYAWPYLKASGNGVIINTASMSGMVGHPAEILPNFAHAATKGAVIALTRQLAVEGAQFKIRANSISPGVIVSPGTEELLKNPTYALGWIPMIPMKRFGECEEVVKVALFLASDESSYITGANLVVDGGLTAN